MKGIFVSYQVDNDFFIVFTQKLNTVKRCTYKCYINESRTLLNSYIIDLVEVFQSLLPSQRWPKEALAGVFGGRRLWWLSCGNRLRGPESSSLSLDPSTPCPAFPSNCHFHMQLLVKWPVARWWVVTYRVLPQIQPLCGLTLMAGHTRLLEAACY